MIRKSGLFTMTFAMLALPVLCRAQSQEPSVGSAIEAVWAEMRKSSA
jgi:hypothetical protein